MTDEELWCFRGGRCGGSDPLANEAKSEVDPLPGLLFSFPFFRRMEAYNDLTDPISPDPGDDPVLGSGFAGVVGRLEDSGLYPVPAIGPTDLVLKDMARFKRPLRSSSKSGLKVVMERC